MSKVREIKGQDANVEPAKWEAGRKLYTKPLFESLGGLRETTLGGSTGVGESGGRKAKVGRG